MLKRQTTSKNDALLTQAGFRSTWAATQAFMADGMASPSRDDTHDLKTHPYRVLRFGPTTRGYAPTLHRELPGLIAKLHHGSEEDIVKFASHYGPLGHFRLVGLDDFLGVDPIPWLITHSRTLDFLLRAINMLSHNEPEDFDAILPLLIPETDDPLFLQPWVKWVAPETKQHPVFPQSKDGRDLANLTNNKPHVSWPLVIGCRGYIEVHHWMFAGPRRNMADMIRMVVRDIVNTNISRLVYALAPEKNGHDQLAMQFSAMIEVAYWHVANTINGGRVAKCEAPGCGAVFIQEDGRQRFCPKGPNNKESPCAIRTRVQEFRRMKKEPPANQGVSHGTKRRKRSRTR